MITQSGLPTTSLRHIEKPQRDALAEKCNSVIIGALVDAWRQGECHLVRKTINDLKNLVLREQLGGDVSRALLPTERPYFNQYIGMETTL